MYVRWRHLIENIETGIVRLLNAQKFLENAKVKIGDRSALVENGTDYSALCNRTQNTNSY